LNVEDTLQTPAQIRRK